jgi:hypothetical protein
MTKTLWSGTTRTKSFRKAKSVRKAHSQQGIPLQLVESLIAGTRCYNPRPESKPDFPGLGLAPAPQIDPFALTREGTLSFNQFSITPSTSTSTQPYPTHTNTHNTEQCRLQ